MSNQIAGLALLGTVSGTGDINLQSIAPEAGSVSSNNLTVGRKAWMVLEAGSGPGKQREIVEGEYIAAVPGAGIMRRGLVRFSTESNNAKINFAANTPVTVYFDVPDIEMVWRFADGTFNLRDELADALNLPVRAAGQTVTASNVNTVLIANAPNALYEVEIYDQGTPANRVSFKVITGPDGGSGTPLVATAYDVLEFGFFELEQSGLVFNVRNTDIATSTFVRLSATNA